MRLLEAVSLQVFRYYAWAVDCWCLPRLYELFWVSNRTRTQKSDSSTKETAGWAPDGFRIISWRRNQQDGQ